MDVFTVEMTPQKSQASKMVGLDLLKKCLEKNLEKNMSQMVIYQLVVSTHLKNISQIGSFPQIGVKIKNFWNHHLVIYHGRIHKTSPTKETNPQRRTWENCTESPNHITSPSLTFVDSPSLTSPGMMVSDSTMGPSIGTCGNSVAIKRYLWWFRNLANQLRLVNYQKLFCKVLFIPGGCLGFLNHQQSVKRFYHYAMRFSMRLDGW